jgi:hypothetical protein
VLYVSVTSLHCTQYTHSVDVVRSISAPAYSMLYILSHGKSRNGNMQIRPFAPSHCYLRNTYLLHSHRIQRIRSSYRISDCPCTAQSMVRLRSTIEADDSFIRYSTLFSVTSKGHRTGTYQSIKLIGHRHPRGADTAIGLGNQRCRVASPVGILIG